jgi:DNA-binding transcriptional LysR family regulator
VFEDLHGINMNLLVALDVLLEEKSVSIAAKRLGCSQPAASTRLAQLRAVFDDPLLVRDGRRLVLTPRATSLAAPLREALSRVSHAIARPDDFDPEQAEGELRIGSRFAEITFVPPLLERLARRAPGLDLRVRDVRAGDLQAMLGAGEVDVLIQPQSLERVFQITRGETARLHESFYFQRLWDEPWVCVVRADHPHVRDELTLAQYASMSHILVSPRGDAYGFVDAALEELDLRRRIALVVSDFMLACVHTTQTDYVLTTHPGVLRAVRPFLKVPLTVLPVPVELPVAVVSQVWHERTHRDPMHRWVRQQIYELGHDFAAA